MNTVVSLKVRIIGGLFLIMAFMCGPAVPAEPAAETNHLLETINYLLEFVKNSDCVFIRNNVEHTASEAAAHMQRKYEYFKDKVQTPEDFIRLTATKSLMTGRLYYVRLRDGEKLTSEAWLLQALDQYRQKQP
jgi:hypothetical protein